MARLYFSMFLLFSRLLIFRSKSEIRIRIASSLLFAMMFAYTRFSTLRALWPKRSVLSVCSNYERTGVMHRMTDVRLFPPSEERRILVSIELR